MAKIIKDPKCVHSQRKGSTLVSSHADLVAAFENDEPHASVRVCQRQECVNDAVRWLNEQNLVPQVIKESEF